MYICTKNEAPTFNSSKVIASMETQMETQRDRDRLTDIQTDSTEILSAYTHGN